MTTVADYMTPGPYTIGREQSLVAAKQMMQKIHARHLPVLHGGKLVGVLSDRELTAIETLPGSRQMTVEDAMVPCVGRIAGTVPLGQKVHYLGRLFCHMDSITSACAGVRCPHRRRWIRRCLRGA